MHPISVYRSIDVAYPWRLRGPSDTQTDSSTLLLMPPALGNRTNGIALGYFSLHNRSGATGAHGIGVRVPNRLWIAGQWDDSEATAFTDDTAHAQDTTATNFALETTTADDGFVVASRVPFNAISIDVGTASVKGTTVARAVRYTNAAGSGWTNFANLFIQDGSADDLAATGTTIANEALIVWAPPVEWGKTQSGGLSGIPEGYYAINVRATDAPDTTAAVADSISIYRIFFLTEGVVDNATLSQDFGAKDFVMAQDWKAEQEGIYGDALVALFQTANNQNRVTVTARAL